MRQLDLLKPKKQKGKAPPAPLEFELHCALADTIKRWLNPKWMATHLPMGEHREGRINSKGQRYSPTAMRLKRMGVTPGWPDFMFVGPGPRIFFLELKRKGSGRVSERQAAVFAHLAASGFGLLVTDSFDDAVATLKSLGILLSNIEVQ